MRASLFTSVLGLSWLVLVSGADAQFAACGRMISCPDLDADGVPDGHCVMPPGESMGSCVPRSCVTTTDPMALASFAEACFRSPRTGARGSFEEGDCDGDLVPNAADVGELCDGATVLTRTGAAIGVVRGARLDVPGGTQVGPEAFTGVDSAFAVGCRGAWQCPVARDGAVRCVLLPVEPADAMPWGACTYGYPLHDDASCLDPVAALDSAGCFAADDVAYERWAHGDCDGDGLLNKQDGPVCRAAQVLGIGGTGLECHPGHFTVATCMDAPRASVGPDLAACAPGLSTAGEVPTAFAVCCAIGHDCPAPSASVHGRCVLFDAGGETTRGACVYDEGLVEDDVSCRAIPETLAFERCGLFSGMDYETFAEGDCDHCRPVDGINRTDDAVCACRGEDAGRPGPEDAATAVGDGGNAQGEDAGASADEDAAAAGDMDATPGVTPRPPVTFAGSGCRCGVAGAGGRTPWPLCLGLALIAVAPLLRRRKR